MANKMSKRPHVSYWQEYWFHRLTPYIEVLSIRVNKSNKAAVCKACINKLGRELALERSVFTNTKTCTKAHLKKFK